MRAAPDKSGRSTPLSAARVGLALLFLSACELAAALAQPPWQELLPWGARGWHAACLQSVVACLAALPALLLLGAGAHRWHHQGRAESPTSSTLRPWQHGAGAALTVTALGAVALLAAWFLGGRALKSALDEELATVAQLAAQRIDPQAHAAITDASQQDSAQYQAVVAPLREMRTKTAQIKYIYTMRPSPQGPVFVVDAADPGDHDADGVDDQSKIGELYAQADPDTIQAVGSSQVLVSREPYSDKWGAFISAFAPVLRPDGAVECTVGVDMTADTYMARRATMSRAVLLGGVLIVLGAAGIGIMVTFIEARRQAAYDQVRATVTRKSKLASQLPGMIYQFRFTPEGRVSFPYASRMMQDLFGVDPDAATDDGSPVFSTIHPDDLPGLMESIRASAADLTPWHHTFRARPAGASEFRWLEGNSVPEREPSGSTLWHGFVTDVTAAKAEEAFRAEQLALTSELSAASSLAEAANAVNSSLARATGLPRAAVLLYNDSGVCSFVGARGLSEEYRAAVNGHCPWKRGERSANPIVVPDVHADAGLAGYAEVFAREGIRALAFIPVQVDTGVVGKLMLYASTAGGVTLSHLRAACMAAAGLGQSVGRLVSREALGRGEHRFRTIIDTALDAVVAMNADGTITEWNRQAEQTFGWSRQEAIGCAMHELIVPENMRTAHLAGLRRYQQTGERRVLGKRVEVPALRKDGSTITVELAITAVQDGSELSYSAFLRDVTEQKRAEAALRQSERTTRLLAENTRDLIGLSAADGRPLYVSPSVQRTLGYSAQEWNSRAARQHVHNDDRALLSAAWEANLQGEATTTRYRALTADGRTVWLERTATPVTAPASRDVEHVVWSSRDVTEQVESGQALESMALTDRLTGLANSALLHDRLEGVISRAARDPARHYAVMFLDFDRFKLVNDTLGHEAGDELLRQIGDRMRGALRASDTLARSASGHTVSRMGGDEFVVVLDGLASPDDARLVAERLLTVLSAPYTIAGQAVNTTASIGLVIGEARYARAAELLRDADTAMYEAKAAGRGRWVLFDEAMRSRLVRRSELERDLAGAGDRGELQVFYQPVVSLEDGAWVGMEALARWTHPRYGPVSPAEFIPIAEESDLIAEVGEWVFHRACTDLARWRRTAVLPPGINIAVNLSRRQLSTPGVSERLGAMTRAAGLTPHDLTIEITETAVMRDKAAGIRMLCALRDQGFRLSLDDFGTGHSSLASLREFPINAVKIDRSFIACVSEERHNAAMMHALADLSRNIGMSIVAEGVETAEQVALLQSIGCANAQGYFFGRPMPADKVPAAALEAQRTRRAA
ncbi:MAG: EAL domain-containing protein [Phycisphaerales bacterium]